MPSENTLIVQHAVAEQALTMPKKVIGDYHRYDLWRDVSELEWEDWHWQTKHRIRSLEALSHIMKPTLEEAEAIKKLHGRLSMAITPYWASLIDADDHECPIRKQCVPTMQEFQTSPSEMSDPCGEDKDSPVPGLIHRYPDRVLLMITDMCFTYCRHCTRRRMVGEHKNVLDLKSLDAAIDYIRSQKKIRDVLISGGDPLMLEDNVLEDILKKLRSISHIELLRIGTRAPVTLPQRITNSLVAMLKKYGPIWFSIHFNHSKEITKRCKFACDMLVDSGFPLGSQTVLLKGINDRPSTIKKLMHDLLKIRVRPYYLYQCDPAKGIYHFRTPISAGINIIEKLRGHTSGYAVPTYVIDAPGGGGKIPIGPNYVISREEGKYTLRNYKGDSYTYIE